MLADAGVQVLQGALHLQLGSAAVAASAPKPPEQVLSHRLKVLLAVKAGAKDFETAHLVQCVGRSKQNVATQLAPHGAHGATATLSGDTDPVLHARHIVVPAVPPKFLAHLVHAVARLLVHAVQATLQSAAQDVIVWVAVATNLALGHYVQVPVIDAGAPTVVTAAESKVQKCVYRQLAHKVSGAAPPVLQAPHPVAVPQVICCVPMMREDTRMIKEIIFRSFFMKKCFYNYNQELIIAYVNYGSLKFISWWRLIGYIIRP